MTRPSLTLAEKLDEIAVKAAEASEFAAAFPDHGLGPGGYRIIRAALDEAVEACAAECEAKAATHVEPVSGPVEITPERLVTAAREAEALRGECREWHRRAARCSHCQQPAACFGRYEGARHGFACDGCCGHGNEDGWCVQLSDLGARWDAVEARAEAAEAALATAEAKLADLERTIADLSHPNIRGAQARVRGDVIAALEKHSKDALHERGQGAAWVRYAAAVVRALGPVRTAADIAREQREADVEWIKRSTGWGLDAISCELAAQPLYTEAGKKETV